MDQLAAAVAHVAMDIDDHAESNKGVSSPDGLLPVIDVLQSIDANTGEPCSPDSII